jgi:putative thioredoxin
MSEGPWVVNVTEANFEDVVVNGSFERPVVVDFWSPRCGPCRVLGPLLERLVNERQGEVLLAKVNTDTAPALAEYFQIEAIPAVKTFRNGQLIHEFEGALPEKSLRAFLNEIAPAAQDDLTQQARALEETRPAEAERLYRAALQENTDDMQARVWLARLLLAQNNLDEVETLLGPVPTEGEVGAEAERLKAQLAFKRSAPGVADEKALRARIAADPRAAEPRYELGCVLAGRGDYPGALEMLLSAAERDYKLASGKVREMMVKVFYALGANHPLSNEYRNKLARLLY